MKDEEIMSAEFVEYLIKLEKILGPKGMSVEDALSMTILGACAMFKNATSFKDLEVLLDLIRDRFATKDEHIPE